MALGDLELMNTEQAAEYLGVTTGRIRQLARAGRVRGIRIGQRAWVFEKSDLDVFIANPPRRGRPPKDAPRPRG